MTQYFTKADMSEIPDWHYYRKIAWTLARRIHGPFAVETRDGTRTCPDGYLALDSNGWPYPIDKAVFEATYMRVEREEERKITGRALPKGC